MSDVLVDSVVAVHMFPVKSLHEATIDGQLPTELEVGARGFEHNGVTDRGWVIADEHDLFVSQRGWDKQKGRKHPEDSKLATVWVDIRHDNLFIEADEHGSLAVPLDTTDTEARSVQIFGPDLPVIDEGDEAGEFFSDILGRAVRLVKADPDRPRMLPAKYQRRGAANQSAGADGRPFTLGSQASLDYLHDQLGWPRGRLPLDQFRHNIDIDGQGFGPFGEDRARTLRAGGLIGYVT